jgi:hypothetical protein
MLGSIDVYQMQMPLPIRRSLSALFSMFGWEVASTLLGTTGEKRAHELWALNNQRNQLVMQVRTRRLEHAACWPVRWLVVWWSGGLCVAGGVAFRSRMFRSRI